MVEPYMGEIRIMGFGFPPRGWATCDGQLLPISQQTALFSILGTTYGGDGKTTFALPDLEGRAAMAWGQGPGLTQRTLGETGGEETVTLIESETPSHTHQLMASNRVGGSGNPEGNTLATAGGANVYADASPDTQLSPQALAPVGGGGPHQNMQPYLTMNFCIALQGVFPPRQ